MLCPTCKLEVRAGLARCPWCGSRLPAGAPVGSPPPPNAGDTGPAAGPPPPVPPTATPSRASLRELGVDAAPPAPDIAPTPVPGQPAGPPDAELTYLHFPGIPAVPPSVAPEAPDEVAVRGQEAPVVEGRETGKPGLAHSSLRDLGVESPPPSLDTAPTPVPGPPAPPSVEPEVATPPADESMPEPDAGEGPELLDPGAATYMPGMDMPGLDAPPHDEPETAAPPADEPTPEQEPSLIEPESVVGPQVLGLEAATYMPGLEIPRLDASTSVEPEAAAPLADEATPEPEAVGASLVEGEPPTPEPEAIEPLDVPAFEALVSDAALPAALVSDEELPAIAEVPLDHAAADGSAASEHDVDSAPPAALAGDVSGAIAAELWTPPAEAPARPSLRDLGVECPPPSLDTAPTPVPDLEPDDMFAALQRGADRRAPGEDVREAGAAPEAVKPSEIGLEPLVGPPLPPEPVDYAMTMGPMPLAGPPPPVAPDDYAMTIGPLVREQPPAPPPPPEQDDYAMTIGPVSMAGPPPPVAPDDHALTMGPQVREEPPGPPPAPLDDAALAAGPPLPAHGTPLRRGSLQGMMGREQAPPSPPVRPTPAVAITPAPAPVPHRPATAVPGEVPPLKVRPVPLAAVAPPGPGSVPVCPHCGARVVGTGVFCSRCGRPLAASVAAPAAVPSTLFCSQCGYRSPPGVRFCMRCGAPMPCVGGVSPAAPAAGAGQRRSKRRRIPWWVWVLIVLLVGGWAAVQWPLDWPDATGMLVTPAGERLVAALQGGFAG